MYLRNLHHKYQAVLPHNLHGRSFLLQGSQFQQSIAPAVTKGNSTLLDWINAEIESLGEENFFHADYEATLLDTYVADYEDTLVIEGGAILC